MKGIYANKMVVLNSLKKTGVIFLVLTLLFIQVPDAFWQQLHTHEHHDCGWPNVVHQYTPDCNLEQRFTLPWNQAITPFLHWILYPYFIILEFKYSCLFSSYQIVIPQNKAPPGSYIKANQPLYFFNL